MCFSFLININSNYQKESFSKIYFKAKSSNYFINTLVWPLLSSLLCFNLRYEKSRYASSQQQPMKESSDVVKSVNCGDTSFWVQMLCSSVVM